MSFLSEYINNLKGKKTKSHEKKTTDTWSGSTRKNIPIRECPFVVFDSELSGLDPRRDFIVSIGAVKMTGGTINISKELSWV